MAGHFIYILLYVWLCAAPRAAAQTPGDSILALVSEDSAFVAATDSAQHTKSKSAWKKLVNYFKNSDKRDETKNFDFGFLPGQCGYHYPARAVG